MTPEQIRALYRRAGMTQEDFAHAINMRTKSVSRWVNGHSEPSRLARKALEDFAARLNGDGGK